MLEQNIRNKEESSVNQKHLVVQHKVTTDDAQFFLEVRVFQNSSDCSFDFFGLPSAIETRRHHKSKIFSLHKFAIARLFARSCFCSRAADTEHLK